MPLLTCLTVTQDRESHHGHSHTHPCLAPRDNHWNDDTVTTRRCQLFPIQAQKPYGDQLMKTYTHTLSLYLDLETISLNGKHHRHNPTKRTPILENCPTFLRWCIFVNVVPIHACVFLSNTKLNTSLQFYKGLFHLKGFMTPDFHRTMKQHPVE